jgi:ComF family protein
MNLRSLNELRHGIVHLFYPRLCEGCSKPLLAAEQVLCIGCSMELPDTGYHNIAGNETEQRFAGRIPFAHATTFAWFTNDGLLQHLVHGLKYKNKKEIGYYLGRQLGQSLQRTITSDGQPGWIKEIDLIIPVPLHPAKKAKRGYNQSTLIAEGMSEVLHIPVSEDALLRVRNTETQTHKTRAERVSNMAEAFTINEKVQLKGKHILLCDDVLTTGATLEACALALLREESIKISIATIGIAVS